MENIAKRRALEAVKNTTAALRSFLTDLQGNRVAMLDAMEIAMEVAKANGANAVEILAAKGDHEAEPWVKALREAAARVEG